MQYEDEEYQPRREQSLLGKIGSFLWKALTFVAVAALAVTGLIFLNDKFAKWVDDKTGGAATNIRNAGDKAASAAGAALQTGKEKAKEGFNWIQDKLGFTTTEVSAPTAAEIAEAKRAETESAKTKALALTGGLAAVPMGISTARIISHAAPGAVSEAISSVTPTAIKQGAGVVKTTVNAGANLLAGSAKLIADTANNVTAYGKDALSIFKIWKPAVDATAATATATTAAAATAATQAAPAVAQAAPAVAQALNAGEVAANISKVLAPAAKYVPIVGAVATVGFDGAHVKDLVKEGKTGSATMQTIGSAAEAGGLFLGPIGFLAGMATKDFMSTANTIATGEQNMTRSALTSLVGETLGADKLAHNVFKSGFDAAYGVKSPEEEAAIKADRAKKAEAIRKTLTPEQTNELNELLNEAKSRKFKIDEMGAIEVMQRRAAHPQPAPAPVVPSKFTGGVTFDMAANQDDISSQHTPAGAPAAGKDKSAPQKN